MCIQILMYVYICTDAYADTYVDNMYAYTYMYRCICICICICMCIWVLYFCICTHVCVHIYLYMYVYIYIRIDTCRHREMCGYICIYTYTYCEPGTRQGTESLRELEEMLESTGNRRIQLFVSCSDINVYTCC